MYKYIIYNSVVTLNNICKVFIFNIYNTGFKHGY